MEREKMDKLNPKILVIGAINMDLVIKAPRMPKTGESLFGEDFKMVPGGKASNYTVAIKRLGGEANLIGKVGNDVFGKTLIENLEQLGINTSYIKKDSKKPTGIALIVVNKEGDNSILVSGGANMDWSKEDVDLIENFFQESCLLLISLEIPLGVIDYALSMAYQYDLKTVLDPGPSQKGSISLLPKVDIISPNETEAEILTGEKVTTINSAKIASQKLLKMGVKTVVIKLGERGALLVDRENEEYFSGIKVPVVDTTAAGDAFTGALTYSYLKEENLRKAIKYANYVGALTVTKFGAHPSIPKKGEVEKFMRNVKGKI